VDALAALGVKLRTTFELRIFRSVFREDRDSAPRHRTTRVVCFARRRKRGINPA